MKPTHRLLSLLVLLLLGATAMVGFTQKPKPTLFLIGDSTVKNSKGKGDGGLWGWGSFLPDYFDSTRVSVQNVALGGTSSRTFRTQGHWDKVLPKVKAGDFVMIQFGHNDGGPVNDTLRARGTLKGNSEETVEIMNLITKKQEVVHSYGWYLRQFIAEVQAKGASAIILSPIPRNNWRDGKTKLNDQDYGLWAAEAAKQGNAVFIDLNKLVADRYDQEGEAPVRKSYFNDKDHTHTLEAGARVNAQAVTTGITQHKKMALQRFLLPKKSAFKR